MKRWHLVILVFFALTQLPAEGGLFRHGRVFGPSSGSGRRIVFFPRLRRYLFGARRSAFSPRGAAPSTPDFGSPQPGGERPTPAVPDFDSQNKGSPDSFDDSLPRLEPPKNSKSPLGGSEKKSSKSRAPGQKKPSGYRSPESLSDYEVLYGNPSLDPQTIAQARANRMAKYQVMSHAGTGFVETSRGRLAEGVGEGSGLFPTTCVATNGTPPLADAVARSSNGTLYRVRLYDSPGTTHP